MPVSRRLLAIWFVCTIVGTLAPFDFVYSRFTLGRVLSGTGTIHYEFDDFARNVVLFLPLGVLVHREGRRQWSLVASAVLVVVTALLVSTTIECMQALLSSRFSSVTDVVANTTGAIIGLTIDVLWGTAVDAGFRRLRARASLLRLSVALACWAILAVAVSGVLQARARLSDWSTSYPLVLANELTGDRPWRGRVFAVTITDAATPLTSVRRFSHGGDATIPGKRLVEFRASGVGLPQRLSGQHLVADWIQRIRKAKAFTVQLSCATDDTSQYGPARILSNSISPFRRNFTIGQERDDLVVRLRTPATGENGARFETHVAGMFSTTAVRAILVTYDGATLLAAAAGTDHVTRTDLTPGTFLADVFVAVTDWDQPITATQLRVFTLAYIAGIYVTPGVLLGFLARTRSDQLVLAALYLIAFAMLFEGALTVASGRPFDWANVVMTAITGAAVFSLTLGALSRRSEKRAPTASRAGFAPDLRASVPGI